MKRNKAAEAIKRKVYLAGLPLGAGAALAVWGLERAQGVLHLVDRVGLPLLAALLVALTVGFWRRRVNFCLLETLLFAGLSLMLLSSLAYSPFLPSEAARTSNLTNLSYWFPALYTLAFLLFGARRGRNVSLLFFAASLAVWGLHGLTGVHQANEELALLQAYAGNGLMLLMLYLVAILGSAREEHADAMETAALTDALTALPNRRHLERLLDEEVARARRYGSPFCVVLFDLDHFKAVNDRFGHEGGDRVLKRVSSLLHSHVRQVDTMGRWGGEEFLVIVPGLNLTPAARFTERLRRVLEAQPGPTEEGNAETVTASFGVAAYGPGDTVADVIHRADMALYRAKQEGRNRVVTLENTPSALSQAATL